MQSKARQNPSPSKQPSEFLDALQKGALVGVALLLLIVPPLRMHQQQSRQPTPPAQTAQAPAAQAPAAPQQQPAPPQVAQAPAPSAESPAAQPSVPEQQAKAPEPPPPPRLAQFGSAKPTPDVRMVANWSVATGDHKKMSFVIVDKKDARVYVFSPEGRLQGNAPVLLGSAFGDHTVPGIGDKPLSQVKPDEKTTPAGRFVAEIGMNARNEDVVWVDYDAAVSMHRVLRTPEAVQKDRRLARLASATPADNRISYGCINVPVPFFEKVLAPTVRRNGAIIYVLPETRSVQKQFGAYDPLSRAQFAQVAHRQAKL